MNIAQASSDTTSDRADSQRASAVAREYAEILPKILNRQDALDLLALLELSLAEPSAAERRHAKLGLIVRLIVSTGALPGPVAYDRAHAEAAARGEQWPDRSSLRRAYGTYEKAEEAAARFLYLGSASRVPDSYRHATNRPGNHAYEGNDVAGTNGAQRPRAILDAVIAFRDAHEGQWPIDEWEFLKWAAGERRRARRNGQPPPPLPSQKPLLRLGPFRETVALAKLIVSE